MVHTVFGILGICGVLFYFFTVGRNLRNKLIQWGLTKQQTGLVMMNYVMGKVLLLLITLFFLYYFGYLT